MNLDNEKIQKIVDSIQAESDRACAVLAGATLDTLLENLLSKLMITNSSNQELFEGTGCLSTFSSKIDLSYALGLISSEEKQSLHLIRKIRNDFAHAIDSELSFDTPAIANRTRSFDLLKLVEGKPILRKENNTSRWRFELTVGSLLTIIQDFRYHKVVKLSEPTNVKSSD